MAPTVGRPPVKGGRQNNQGAVENSATESTGRDDGRPSVGDRFHYACPLCDKAKGTADYALSRSSGAERWFIDCRRADCQGDDYPERVAAEVGCSTWELIEDPRQWLGDRIEHGRCRGEEEPEPLPTPALLAGWQARLRSDRRALRYLRRECGLTAAVIDRYGLGYALPGAWPRARWACEPGGFVLPIYRDGELVGARKRFWPKVPTNGVKYTGPAGHAALLYPEPPWSRAVVLCEGELDALTGRVRGLPVVSTTCGASLPEQLAGAFKGRRVAVVYDTGALASAARTVDRLLAAGAREAWAVDLVLPGEGDDLTDWFVTYKRTAGELRRLIRRSG